MAERLAQAAGADLEIVRAAALLHDAAPEQAEAGDAAAVFSTAEEREKHHHASAGLAARVLRAEGWAEERIAAVQHCIRSHRFRDSAEPPLTLEAQVLFDADKLDAIGAIGVARAIGYAAQSGQPAWAQPSAQFLQTGKLEPGEAHTAYHEYVFKLVKLKERLFTAAARQVAAERHQVMEAFFSRLAAEMQGEA
jgi:uncharacterized protein